MKKAGSRKKFLLLDCSIYNLDELKEKFSLKAKNSKQALKELIELKGLAALDLVEGAYAVAFTEKGRLFLARDVVGLKPLWFVLGKKPAVAFHKKKLEKKAGKKAPAVQELNPRKILVYDLKSKKSKFIQRNFFSTKPELTKEKKQLKEELKQLLIQAVEKRLPNKRFGLFFSGGLDSTLLALICKKLEADFVCYTATVKRGKAFSDALFAELVAKELKLKHKVVEVEKEQVPGLLKKVVPLLESSDVIRASVGVTLFTAAQAAKKDRIRLMFSGAGSDELFASYQRFEESEDLNRDCLARLLQLCQNDLYRDELIVHSNGQAARTPFLDSKIIDFALRLPAEYKIENKVKKAILREIAMDLGLKKEFAFREKKAAQYGSGFDWAIQKLSNRQKAKGKSEYLKQFYKKPNMKLAALFSSGKDSMYAMEMMLRQNYSIECLVTIDSRNPDSFMYHTPNVKLVKLQAKALGLPVVFQKTSGEKEKELTDLKKALQKAQKKYLIEGICTGALWSNYQKNRIEDICEGLGLKVFSPLWHKPQDKEMLEILHAGIKFVFTSIAAQGLNKEWLGKEIKAEDVEKLAELNERIGLNIAGEGGEFESLVVDSPRFKKRIELKKFKIIEENEFTALMKIENAVLAKK